MCNKEIENFFSSLYSFSNLKEPIEKKKSKYFSFFKIKKIFYKSLICPLQSKALVLHVAGTNGKGSTCKILSTLLISKGYRVGTFLSPHIFSYNERILYQNSPISNKNLLSLIYTYKKSYQHLPFFKNQFFLAIFTLFLLYFQNKPIDFLVIETGVGGKFDYTNFFTKKICIIQSIHLDHCEYLGKTISKITYQKAGIIHKKNPTFVSMQEFPYVYSLIKKIAISKNSIIKHYGKDFFIKSVTIKNNTKIFSLAINKSISYVKISKWTPKIQIINILIALNVLDSLSIRFSSEINFYMEKFNIFARSQILKNKPKIIIDVSHNLQSLLFSLSNILSLNEIFLNHYLILGISNRIYIDYLSILPKIIPYFNSISLIYIPILQDKQPNISNILNWLIQKYPLKKFYLFNSLNKAYSFFNPSLKKKDLLFMAGSFYIVKDIKKIFPFSF